MSQHIRSSVELRLAQSAALRPNSTLSITQLQSYYPCLDEDLARFNNARPFAGACQQTMNIAANKALLDDYWIDCCLELAARGAGDVAPNPMVGCVIVREQRALSCGWHQRYGMPHAEINALQAVEIDYRGATLYVNLEPCSSYGKTPPCVEAIIKAGIKRVVCCELDSCLKNKGHGFIALQQAGVVVEVGIKKTQAQHLNCIFHRQQQLKKPQARPYVMAKWAMSLDGKMVTAEGDSASLSHDQAWRHTQYLRQSVAAVMIGGETARQDNPALNWRLADPHDNALSQHYSPLPIIVSGRGRLNWSAYLLRKNPCFPSLVVVGDQLSHDVLDRINARGHHCLVMPSIAGKVNLADLLHYLYEVGLCSVLLEGGRMLMNQFFQQQLVDHCETYIAPYIIGQNMQRLHVACHWQRPCAIDTHLISSGLHTIAHDQA